MTTVTCVLKRGKDYTARWAYALYRGLARHMPEPWRFACLSDDPDVPGYVPLPHDWPSFWCLVNWYRPGLFDGRVIAVGLDTLPVGDLSEICAYDGPLAGIDDFYRNDRLASGVMSWTGDEAAFLHEAFLEDPSGIMARYNRHDLWLRDMAPNAGRLQRHVPGQIVSYKVHAKAGVPEGARLVCGHGRPSFASGDAGWASDLWQRRAA